MKAPLGRTARIWTLTLLLGGVSLLAAIAWIGFGHTPPQNNQPPEISEGLVETATSPVVRAVPAAPPAQAKTTKPAPQSEYKTDLQIQAKPAQVDPQPAPQLRANLAEGTTVPLRTGVFGGLNRIVGWVAAMRDAGTAGAK